MQAETGGNKTMGIIYFDICAIPLFLMILFVCYSRKMTNGNANHLFIAVVLLSLVSTIADLGMEIADNMVPLSGAGYMICTVSAYLYLALRNATNAVLLLFLLYLTQTSFLIRKKWVKIVFCLPYAAILVMLVQNPFTFSAFSVTAEDGYSRGPLMLAFYGMALIYGIIGFIYCIYCRRYFPVKKWIALLSVYVLSHLAVLIQFFHPELLLEMFCTAVGEMMILLTVMRPEERMDNEVGMLSWTSYQSDIRNILLSKEHVQIIVMQMLNCLEIRNYLGDQKYNEYLSRIMDGIRSIQWKHPHRSELYLERPGTIYIITDAEDALTKSGGECLLSTISEKISNDTGTGVSLKSQVCLINCPEDLKKKEDILSLGHKFHKICSQDQSVVCAEEIVHSKTFTIEAHIEEILDRAIKENHIEMYYQPIYDIRSGCFRSAEALARIQDPEYGLISPGIFIPAAETQGLIIPLGDAVLDLVFRFISEHDLGALGLSYIEVNLSVAQCMESSLPEKIRKLQQAYGVDPGQVNLEITETTFENISDIMLKNVNELIRMGYSFALDDYGIGYSSIQRVNHLPLKLIKLDKSMLDEISNENGRIILEYTMRMMQDTGKWIVAEGAETRDAVELLENMGCDYIQGFYFSRPLPSEEFLCFIRKHL